MHFIYVMSEQDKDKLLALGYTIMKEDVRNHVWVFRVKDTEVFSHDIAACEAGVHFIRSNTLTF